MEWGCKGMKTKPNRIYELRRSRGISQEKLAEELNVTQASVSLYENGSNIPSDILIALSEYFDVSIEYLLKLSEENRDIEINNVSQTEYNIIKIYRGLPERFKKVTDSVIKYLVDETNVEN